MDSISQLFDRLKPLIIALIQQIVQGSIQSTTGASGAGQTIDDTLLLYADGSRQLAGNLSVATGKTIDGVDVSQLGADYTGHLGADSHPLYAAADESGLTRPAYQAERLTKAVVAGAGLTGGGVLDDDRTLNIGAGTGISVAADAVAIDQAAALNWTGAHSHAQTLTTHHLEPALPDTSDIGSWLKRYRRGFMSEIDAVIFAKNVASLLGGWLIIGKNAGSLAQDVTLQSQIDFGQAMTPGDFIVFRDVGALEYMQIGTLVSGTTYNVTRNVDGSGLNAWPEGTPYLVLGQSGAGRIELNAYDTPRIQMLEQGATYNAQTELLRIGDLNGNWGYVVPTYGVAIGPYAAGKPNIVIDASALRLRRHNQDIIKIDTTGAKIAGNIEIDGGSIFVGPLTINGDGIAIVENSSDPGPEAMYRIANGIGGEGAVKLETVASEYRLIMEIEAHLGRDSKAQVIANSQNMDDAQARLWAVNGGTTAHVTAEVRDLDGINLESRVELSATRIYQGSAAVLHGQTSLPSFSNITNDRRYHTNHRAEYLWDGSAWRQLTVGAFTGGWPASPTDGLRVWRLDRGRAYYYIIAETRWVEEQIQNMPLLEERVQQPWDATNVATTDTVVANYAIDVRDYGARIEGYMQFFIPTTNNGTNYYTYTLRVAANGGGSPTTLLTGNTSALAANANHVVTIGTPVIFAAATPGAVAQLVLRRTGTPGAASFRPYIRYRNIG